ncbi:MAG: hypothetical protein WKF71_10500 [Pyrinomonadaceae bacterium]
MGLVAGRKKLVGTLPLGERGVAVYSFETKRLERVAENNDRGDTIPSWLADSRRVVFESKNKIFITASETKKQKKFFFVPLKTLVLHSSAAIIVFFTRRFV